jgi:LacI family transcriptional regulator
MPERVRRIQGFRAALMARNIPIINQWIVPSQEPTIECGYEAAYNLLINYPEISAIFAYNDLLALGAIRACHDLGRAVPASCAIIGYDDIVWAAIATPALTTIRVDKYELGRQAMTRLLAMLDEPDRQFPAVHLGIELVVRASA